MAHDGRFRFFLLLPITPFKSQPNHLLHFDHKLSKPLTNKQHCSFAEEDNSGVDSEGEISTYIDTSSQSNKKRKKPSDDEESDHEPNRPPLSASLHANRERVRLDHHKTMAKRTSIPHASATKKAPRKKASRRKGEESDSEEEGNNENRVGIDKKEEEKIRQRIRFAISSGTMALNKSEAMELVVAKTTKRELWKICKFIKNEDFLLKATNYVMQCLDLSDFEGYHGKELIERQEIWKATYSSVVREALNRHRNYVQGEIRKVVFEDLIANDPPDLPNKEELVNLVLRDKLEDDTPKDEREHHEKLFDKYWTVLLPKVAGNSFWGPSRRHYYLPSNGKDDRLVPEGSELEESVPLVSASDEAFLAVTYINAYHKWVKQAEKHEESVEKRKTDPNALLYDPSKDKEDYKLPYTNAKAGNKKFGGWRSEGILKYDKLVKDIEDNRKKNRKFVKDVEAAALERIQKEVGIIGDNESAKKKKPKTKSENYFADAKAGKENDFSTW